MGDCGCKKNRAATAGDPDRVLAESITAARNDGNDRRLRLLEAEQARRMSTRQAIANQREKAGRRP